MAFGVLLVSSLDISSPMWTFLLACFELFLSLRYYKTLQACLMFSHILESVISPTRQGYVFLKTLDTLLLKCMEEITVCWFITITYPEMRMPIFPTPLPQIGWFQRVCRKLTSAEIRVPVCACVCKRQMPGEQLGFPFFCHYIDCLQPSFLPPTLLDLTSLLISCRENWKEPFTPSIRAPATLGGGEWEWENSLKVCLPCFLNLQEITWPSFFIFS